MAAVENFQSALHSLPEPLRARVARDWEAYAATGFADGLPDILQAQLVQVWAASEFVAESCLRQPALLPALHASGDLARAYPADYYQQALSALLSGLSAEAADEARLGSLLRRFRRREMVRIAWRDLAGLSDLAEALAALSALADACIEQALELLHGWHCMQWGTPLAVDGTPQRMVVLALGKLGAQELNFSSDIDLIFTYPQDGETRGGRRSLSNQEFFIRLAQRLSNVLGQITAEGFVFRVDARLRPFGEASALALSFDALEDYYQIHGREWERYAMIKARVAAGDRAAGEALLAMLRPFVYRRYIDFGVFQSLREMKAMIGREIQRTDRVDNIKLGFGGIREVEFVGQAFQLVRGGREPALQVRALLAVLAELRRQNLLPGYVLDELRQGYVFLRTVEHRLQMYRDCQTHDLPKDAAGRLRLAWSMGYAGWAPFSRDLQGWRQRIHEHFEQVFAAPQASQEDGHSLDFVGVWQGTLEDARALAVLDSAGYRDAPAAWQQIRQLRQGRVYLQLGAQGRTRLGQLMPLLLAAVGQADAPDQTLPRVLFLLEEIARRSAYLALLVENPMALSQLVRLCAASPWIVSQLARLPLLLDELLDPRTLYAPPLRDEIAAELRQRLQQVSADDQEGQMDVLRLCLQANLLRVAAADVVGAVPLMVVSDHLTALAEVLLEATLRLARKHVLARHGPPAGGSGFAIIAYGKLGGIELGYGSDLDLIFLHGNAVPVPALSPEPLQLSPGESLGEEPVPPLEDAVFHARLARRVIHLLSTRTTAGVLYETDTRLRPSGSSGLLVSSLEAFAAYQQEEAWTWEHQALVRARGVAGDPQVLAAFDAIRRQVLARSREPQQLRGEVRGMRERMRRELDSSDARLFDLKQGAGGIADIEFMVQYGVLAWAVKYPSLLDFTDNIRLLEGLADNGCIAAAQADLLTDAYRAYRSQVHRLALQEQPARVPATEFVGLREQVLDVWRAWLEID